MGFGVGLELGFSKVVHPVGLPRGGWSEFRELRG